jgi:hypothetical protein
MALLPSLIRLLEPDFTPYDDDEQQSRAQNLENPGHKRNTPKCVKPNQFTVKAEPTQT